MFAVDPVFWSIIIAFAFVLCALCSIIRSWPLKKASGGNKFPIATCCALIAKCALIVIGIALVGVGIIYMQFTEDYYLSFFTIGVGSFILSLMVMSYLTELSLSEGDRRKSIILDRKEIRRSIAISLTILYILLISLYLREVASVLPPTDNVTNVLTTNGTTSLINTGLTTFKDVIVAFTGVYTVIISFYFGSRIYEKIKEIKNAEELLKIQFLLGDINSKDFRRKMNELRGKGIIIENIKINSEKKLLINVRNIGDKKVKVDSVYVIKDNEAITGNCPETEIEPCKVKELIFSPSPRIEKCEGTYKIKVATIEGFTDECEYEKKDC